jgi:hypothetical protein
MSFFGSYRKSLNNRNITSNPNSFKRARYDENPTNSNNSSTVELLSEQGRTVGAEPFVTVINRVQSTYSKSSDRGCGTSRDCNKSSTVELL